MTDANTIDDDRRLISDKLALWCRCVDTLDMGRLSEVFVQDLEWDFDGVVVEKSLSRIVNRIVQHIGNNPFCGATQHCLSNMVIDIEGESAESHAYFCAAHAGAGDLEGQTLVVWGIYNDFWQRTEEGWRIVRRLYSRNIFDGPKNILYPDGIHRT